MKLASHYMRLREHFPLVREDDELEVTVNELAAILDCTHRNTILVLNRMTQQKWLRWIPRRGRGKRSTLIFCLHKEQFILQMAKELVKKKDLRGALEQMNVSSIPAAVKEHFNEWLYGYFGYTTEVRNERRVDTLRFPLTQPFTTLDPKLMNLTTESHLVSQIFNSLVKNHPATRTIEPHLAHAWETDSTRTRWTFYLRKGVLFHDGRELNAEDVRYSLDRLRCSEIKSLYRWLYMRIKDIRALDPTTVEFQLMEPNELFLQYLGTNRASIVPKDIVEQQGEKFGQLPVGTGPFRVVTNDRSMCVLEAFPYYWQGRAHLDRVEIWNIPNLYTDKGMEGFQIIHNLRQTEPRKRSSDVWEEVQQQSTTCKFMTFNVLKQGPIQNEQLRDVLIQSFNREKLVELLEGDDSFPTDGFLGQSERIKPLQRKPLTPEQVKELLIKAGYQGEELELCTIPHYEKDAQSIQAQCGEAGFRLRVTLLTPEEFKGEQRLKADLILFALLLDHDEELRLIDLYKSMQPHMKFAASARIDKNISAILREPSRAARLKRLTDIEDALKADSAILFLYQKHLKTSYHPSVRGVSLDSPGFVQFKDIWFKP